VFDAPENSIGAAGHIDAPVATANMRLDRVDGQVGPVGCRSCRESGPSQSSRPQEEDHPKELTMTTGPQDGVNTTAEKLTKTAQNVAGAASDTAAAVGDRVSAAVDDLRHNDTVTGISKKIGGFCREHPKLAIAAIGFLFAVVIGILARRNQH
jgi:hypothetical protein